MSHPQVVNVTGKHVAPYIYIGRRFGKFAESPYANPFKISAKLSRSEAVAAYRDWLDGKLVVDGLEGRRREILLHIPTLAISLDEGGKLGCWCAPQLCHGEVLVELCERHLGRKFAPAVGGGGGREGR